MKYQTNPELGPFINHWGCLFCSILEKAEKSIDWERKFSNADVVEVYKKCISLGFISKEVTNDNGVPIGGCWVINAPEVFNTAVEKLGGVMKCTGYRKVESSYVPKLHEEEILCLARKGYGGNHFVSGNGKVFSSLKDEIEFDPWEGGSRCAREGYIDSKRILIIQ